MGKLLRRIGLGVVAALLLGAVTLSALVATGTLPYKVYVIHTGSMDPTFPVKSAVIVREHRYHVGEPVSFVTGPGGQVITHRLVAINTHGVITTKGDANKTIDPWHEPTTDIIGGVVAAPRMVGYLIVFLGNPLGSASIVLCIASFWLLWSIAGDLESGGHQAMSQKGRCRAGARPHGGATRIRNSLGDTAAIPEALRSRRWAPNKRR